MIFKRPLIILFLTVLLCKSNVTENVPTEDYITSTTENVVTLTSEPNNKMREEIYHKGFYDGHYRQMLNTSKGSLKYYMHGSVRKPRKHYYYNLHYRHNEADGTALDYYLGYAITQMNDADFNYSNYHHFYHDINRTIPETESILSDIVIRCHPNATFLCPENTENVCLMNGTIYCMSKINVVRPCLGNSSLQCVTSTIPCVNDCGENYMEQISLPCLSIVVIEDIYEVDGGMTIARVSGTFVLAPAIKQEDRTFCVTVIVDPISARLSP